MTKTTLVLLPGLLNTRRVFEHQIEALSDIADCIVPELWHHDAVDAMAEAVLSAVPQSFALAGFSMGGYVSFEIMRRAPQRVERLALIDTQAAPDAPDTIKHRQGLVEQTHIGRFHGVGPLLMQQMVHKANLGNPAVTRPILDMAQVVGPEGFVREQKAIMGRRDSRRLLVDIAVPTLVMVGRQDQVTPLVRSQEMAADIATSQLVVLEDCGHMSPLEKPQEVSAALRGWLTG